MSLWIQQGYGKSDKIQRLAAEGAVHGVILSPADEERATLADTAASARANGLDLLMDPQTYVGTISGGTGRCHESHGLRFDQVHWGANPAEISDHVAAVIAAHEAVGLDRVCSPTCIQRGFNDAWTTLAIQYARATVDAVEDAFVSVVFDEAALSDWRGIEDWLDVVTTLNASGFYLVVVRSSTDYPQAWDAARLANLLRLIYRLSVLNRYRVVLGYADMEGLLAQVAGADSFGSGWFYTLRAFTELKWQPASGGRSAKPRVTSPSLLTSMRVEGEGALVARSALASRAFPEEGVRERMGLDAPDWSLPESWFQHLVALGSLADGLHQEGSLAAQRLRLSQLLDDASTLFDELNAARVPLPTPYQTRVRVYRAALAEFEAREAPS